MEKIISFAHSLLNKYVTKDDVTIDATIGNGKDTLFLASISNFVYGFDIQSKAVENTKSLLNSNGFNNFELFLKSHEYIDEVKSKNIKGIIYNLGYLPNGNKDITTMTESTILSLSKAIKIIANHGIICLVCYPGHEEGCKESFEVTKFCEGLNQKEYDVITYKFINQINNPSYLIAIEKL